MNNLVCSTVNLYSESEGDYLKNIRKERIHFESIYINASGGNVSKLLLNHIAINNFVLTGYLTSTIHLKNIFILNLSILDFVNEGKLKLHDINVDSTGYVVISDSQLGKAEFNYVNFDKVTTFKVFLSNLTELIINNTTFPNNIIGRYSTDYSGIREVYRQLKNTYSKQGDRVSELKYEQTEMHALHKLLADNYTVNLNDTWRDRIILFTNKYSNNHGQDWFRAIIGLFIGNFILYTLIELILTSHPASNFITFSNLAQYLNFTLNPLHKFKELFSEHNNQKTWKGDLAEIIDLFGRLFSGYMIFQFLRAFRKFAK